MGVSGILFLDDVERSVFMEKLDKTRETGRYKLFAYCIVDNQPKEGEELGASIKRMTVGGRIVGR